MYSPVHLIIRQQESIPRAGLLDYADRARRRRTLADLPPLHTLSNREWLSALDAEDDFPPLDDDPAADWQIGRFGAAAALDYFGGLDATGSEDHE